MPTYVYEFEDTGERVERVERMADPRATRIGGRPVRQVFLPGGGYVIKEGFRPHVNRQVAPNDPTYAHCKKDARGRPIIESVEDHKRSSAVLEKLTNGKAFRVWDED